MNKKLIRLTESDLHRIVAESVKRILNEDPLTNLRLSDETSTGEKRNPRQIKHGTAEIPENWEDENDRILKKLQKQKERQAKAKAKAEKLARRLRSI